MFSITDENLPVGGYVLTIVATDVLGQSAILEVPFTLTGTLRCVTIIIKSAVIN